MNILILILIALFSIIALLFIIALFMRKDYNIHRDIIINAPQQKVYDYLKQLKNQDNFNKWVMVDPTMKRDFKGTDGTVGFIYGWNGNKKAGEGEQEIKALEEGKRIETEIRFIRPFAGVSYANTVITGISADQTKVTWSNKSVMNYPMNLLLSMIEKMLAKDMDISLLNLKKILEK
ncbi:MAG: SRPBCC family protein [Bacteroidota bacterium]|nr:SRPBCC family protein [Bacteroidota bacterium]